MNKSTALLLIFLVLLFAGQITYTISLMQQNAVFESRCYEQFQTKIDLTQQILNNEFKLGVYAAILTMRDEKILDDTAEIAKLVQMSISRQDSLRTKIVEVTQ
jgi:hypothetical protein